MDFFFFILVNVMLFVRPAEILPGLDDLPLYEVAILISLAVSSRGVLQQLTPHRLSAQPLSVWVLGLLATVILSHLSHGAFEDAGTWGLRFLKIALYYLLLVAVVNTRARLRRFLSWIGGLILGLTTLTLLQHHQVINLPALEAIQQSERNPATGEFVTFPRLCGMGIFNDPNDLSVILVVGMMISLYRLGEHGLSRLVWMFALCAMGYALTLTHSRGGLLALVAGLGGVLAARLSVSKGLFLLAIMLVPLLYLGGRQTAFDLGNKSDTGQHRIQLWREGLLLLHRNPVFGIGPGRYESEAGLVAHNSFIHAFTELGIVGGVFFLGAFIYPIGVIYRSGHQRAAPLDPQLRHLRPYILGCALAMAGGMVSLSRVYTLTPYLVLGVVAVYLNLAAQSSRLLSPRMSSKLVMRVVYLTLAFLAIAEIFVRTLALRG